MYAPSSRSTRPVYWLLVCAFVAIAVFYVWNDHRSHLWGALPYVLLLACPFMHMLMHRHHGESGASHGEPDAHPKHGSRP